MSHSLDDAALLAAELLARRWLPRQHPKVKRALIDTELWQATQERLGQVGLKLVDNLYADHVAVALLRPAESAVFGEAGLNSHNNIDLPRDAVSLLVVLWSLIVLPKRERQAARANNPQAIGTNEMFPSQQPIPTAASVSAMVPYRALLADFGVQLGKKTRLDTNLKRLETHGFITRKGEDIFEGPLLDLLLDYDALAPRILQGALADVLNSARNLAPQLPKVMDDDEYDAVRAAADDTVDETAAHDAETPMSAATNAPPEEPHAD